MKTQHKVFAVKAILLIMMLLGVHVVSLLMTLDFTRLTALLALALVIDSRVDAFLYHQAYMALFGKLKPEQEDGTNDSN